MYRGIVIHLLGGKVSLSLLFKATPPPHRGYTIYRYTICATWLETVTDTPLASAQKSLRISTFDIRRFTSRLRTFPGPAVWDILNEKGQPYKPFVAPLSHTRFWREDRGGPLSQSLALFSFVR